MVNIWQNLPDNERSNKKSTLGNYRAVTKNFKIDGSSSEMSNSWPMGCMRPSTSNATTQDFKLLILIM